jgi:hypothetical protein
VVAPANASGPPTIAFEDQICLPDGSSNVFWDVFNTKDVAIKLLALDLTPAGSPNDFTPNALLAAGAEVEFTQLVPAGTAGASATVSFLPTGEQDVATASDSAELEDCPVLVGATFQPNCDGTTNVHIFNKTDGTIDFHLNGDDSAANMQTVLSGGTADIPNVPADAQGHVTVQAEKFTFADFEWTSPSDCPSPTTTPDASLPTTGSSLTGIVGAGGGLLIGGIIVLAALFLLRRRRTGDAG